MQTHFRRLNVVALILFQVVDPRCATAQPIGPTRVTYSKMNEQALNAGAVWFLNFLLQHRYAAATRHIGGRLFLSFGIIVEEVSHGIRAEAAGFTVRWKTLNAWGRPGIDIDEMNSHEFRGPKSEAYHRNALGVARAGFIGNGLVAGVLAACEVLDAVFHPVILPLLLGGIALASTITVILRNRNRSEPDSDTQRMRYHRQELRRMQALSVLGLGLMWTGRSRPYLPGQEADRVEPTDQEIEEYLAFAIAHIGNRQGRVVLDTAAAYGPSEERLGRILRAHPEWAPYVLITTKGGEEWDPETGKSTLKQSKTDLLASLARSRTRVEPIDIGWFYIHQTTLKVLQDQEAMNALRDLKRARTGGLEQLGLSISRPDVLEEIVHASAAHPELLNGIDLLQLPTQVFLNRPDLIQPLATRGIKMVLNRPNLAVGEMDPGEFYRALAARPEVAVILGGGRTHLPKTVGYLWSSEGVDVPKSSRVQAKIDRRQFIGAIGASLFSKAPSGEIPDSVLNQRLAGLLEKYALLAFDRFGSTLLAIAYTFGSSPRDEDITHFLEVDPLNDELLGHLWEWFESDYSEIAGHWQGMQASYRNDPSHTGNVLELAELRELDQFLTQEKGNIASAQHPFFASSPQLEATAAAILKAFKAASLAELQIMDRDYWSYFDRLYVSWGHPPGGWTIPKIRAKIIADIADQVHLAYSVASHFADQMQRLAGHPYAPDGAKALLDAFINGPQVLATNPWTRMSKRYWHIQSTTRWGHTTKSVQRLHRIDQQMRALGFRQSIPASVSDPYVKKVSSGKLISGKIDITNLHRLHALHSAT